MVLQLPLTQATSRMSGFSIVLAGGAAQALAFACLVVSPALPFLVIAVTAFALSQILSRPLVQAIITELAPRHAQATYQAAFSVASDLRDAAGPAIGTWLYAVSALLPWSSGVAVSLAAAFGVAVAARRHEQGHENR